MRFSWKIALLFLENNKSITNEDWEYGAYIYMVNSKYYNEDGVRISDLLISEFNTTYNWILYSNKDHGPHKLFSIDEFRENNITNY